MHVAKIYITLKKSVLDPQGITIKHALESMGYSDVKDVRAGKFMEITFNGNQDRQVIEQRLMQMCDRLLTNPVIENYHFEVEQVT